MESKVNGFNSEEELNEINLEPEAFKPEDKQFKKIKDKGIMKKYYMHSKWKNNDLIKIKNIQNITVFNAEVKYLYIL